jgi:hypothetical protein
VIMLAAGVMQGRMQCESCQVFLCCCSKIGVQIVNVAVLYNRKEVRRERNECTSLARTIEVTKY